MYKVISIDPGKCKCGLVLVDINKKKVDQAIVLNTEFLPLYVKTLKNVENFIRDLKKLKHEKFARKILFCKSIIALLWSSSNHRV